MRIDNLTRQIIGCAIKVHKKLGRGIYESAYETKLYHELIDCHLHVERQKPVPLMHNTVRTTRVYLLDLIVENLVIVEVKARAKVPLRTDAQLHTYMRLLNCPAGLIINFHVKWLKNGIRRLNNPEYRAPR